jgi:acyl CoA:acetate/3-ketoacid CoA transferase beta subunit
MTAGEARRRAVCALVGVLVLGSHGANATADGCAVVLKTPDGFLNLRKAPTTSSEVVAKLNRATCYTSTPRPARLVAICRFTLNPRH